MIIPAKRLFIVFWFIVALAIIASIWPESTNIWLFVSAITAVVVMLDGLLTYRPSDKLRAVRTVSSSLPLGVDRMVELRIHNESNRHTQLKVFDHHPLEIQTVGLPVTIHLAKGTYADLSYKIHAVERGKMEFSCTQIHSLSLLGFWIRDHRLPVRSEVHVYPNFAAVSHYALMATDNKLSQMGIIKKRRRGEGQDFHQLREYRKGDSLRQIDWKASSRMRKVIAREYQDERDQEIIFLLDCGHRMQAKDNDLSHFDHTLNAILLLSYVALKQGDAVGLGTFSGASRWIAPRKGQQVIQQILNTVYDLQPSPESPDYSQVATDLMVRHKKRALIILITNLRDEDADDLLPALKLLRKRHLVLLVSMREEAIDEVLEKPINDYNDALLNSATHQYLQHRQRTFDKIRSAKVLSMDVVPSDLSAGLINHYLDIKGSGLL
ncbi:MAG: DUF58 domain-containing protein [Thiotrichaceae bacterium]|nr:DUF58 domain-containing protein [Thiotrichaceae bacterium]